MSLPANFKWIDSIGTLPKMVQEGIKVLGIKEIPGPTSNPEILKFAAEIGVSSIYKNDDTSWCAVSHNAIAKRAGKVISFLDKYDYLRALAFLKIGDQFNVDTWLIIDNRDAKFGDTLIFQRPGGGHVGMYIGESTTHYYVMGGNQSNMYSFTRVSKERLVGVRRPKYIYMPVSVKKYTLNDTGTPITSNES